MTDLFGDWVPSKWIKSVLATVRKNPRHTFQFLTKNPKRLKDFNPWPANCWVGTTVTNQADADERFPCLVQVEAPVRFVSHEPLLGEINIKPWLNLAKYRHGYDGETFLARADFLSKPKVHWAIIGAQTGPGAVKPKSEWVQGLIDQYWAAGVPVFLKDNLKWPEKIQEWPDGQEWNQLPEVAG